MAFEEVKILSKSEKSTVYLIREEGGEQLFIRKTLKGKHPVYTELQKLKHPFLPEFYEVHVSDTETTVIEEYIWGGADSGQYGIIPEAVSEYRQGTLFCLGISAWERNHSP